METISIYIETMSIYIYIYIYGNKICNNLRFIFSFPEFPLILLNTLFYTIFLQANCF